MLPLGQVVMIPAFCTSVVLDGVALYHDSRVPCLPGCYVIVIVIVLV